MYDYYYLRIATTVDIHKKPCMYLGPEVFGVLKMQKNTYWF